MNVCQSGSIYNQNKYFVLYIKTDSNPILWFTSTWTNVNLNWKTKRKGNFCLIFNSKYLFPNDSNNFHWRIVTEHIKEISISLCWQLLWFHQSKIREKNTTYQENVEKSYVCLKASISFQLQQQPLATIHIEKLYRIFFLPSNNFYDHEIINKRKSVSLRWQVIQKKCNIKNSHKVYVYHSGIYNQNKDFVPHWQIDQIFHKQTYFFGWQIHELLLI